MRPDYIDAEIWEAMLPPKWTPDFDGHLYPHCRHCSWGSEHHPDDAPAHTTPCVLGCEGHTPITQEGLF